MTKPYTVLISLQAKTPDGGPELDSALKAATANVLKAPGLLSHEAYRYQEGARYVSIIKWKDEASNAAHMQHNDGCPVGKLIQAGKVDFQFGVAERV
jgi:heme-degrading monooxygenase HmoA